jgi:hypothetical protein
VDNASYDRRSSIAAPTPSWRRESSADDWTGTEKTGAPAARARRTVTKNMTEEETDKIKETWRKGGRRDWTVD